MKTAQAPQGRCSDEMISAILSSETPLWVRLIRECREQLEADKDSVEPKEEEKARPGQTDAEDPFGELLS